MLVLAPFLSGLQYLLGGSECISPVFITFVFSHSMLSYKPSENHRIFLRECDMAEAAKGSQIADFVFLELFTRPQQCLPPNSPLSCGPGTSSTYGITNLVPGCTPQHPPSDFSRPSSLCRSPCWLCLQVYLSRSPLRFNSEKANLIFPALPPPHRRISFRYV